MLIRLRRQRRRTVPQAFQVHIFMPVLRLRRCRIHRRIHGLDRPQIPEELAGFKAHPAHQIRSGPGNRQNRGFPMQLCGDQRSSCNASIFACMLSMNPNFLKRGNVPSRLPGNADFRLKWLIRNRKGRGAGETPALMVHSRDRVILDHFCSPTFFRPVPRSSPETCFVVNEPADARHRRRI